MTESGTDRPVAVHAALGEPADFGALISALDSGHLGGAALDVLPVELPCDERAGTRDRWWVPPLAGYRSPAAARAHVVGPARNATTWPTTGRPLEPVIR